MKKNFFLLLSLPFLALIVLLSGFTIDNNAKKTKPFAKGPATDVALTSVTAKFEYTNSDAGGSYSYYAFNYTITNVGKGPINLSDIMLGAESADGMTGFGGASVPSTRKLTPGKSYSGTFWGSVRNSAITQARVSVSVSPGVIDNPANNVLTINLPPAQ